MPGMLSGKSHDELYRMRAHAAPQAQGMLAPFEHRAFAREWAQESPVVAGASLPFAIPAYQLAKLLGLQKARTPASLDELFAGYHGMAEGMLDRMMPSAYAHHEESETIQRPDGKWINVYGRRKPQRGQRLPNSGVYDSESEAVQAARQRSESYKPEGTIDRVRGDMPQKRPAYPKRTPSEGVRG